MGDGVRLAMDVHVPSSAEASGRPVPTILHQTRYFRSVAMRRAVGWIPLGPAMDSDWQTRGRFLDAGYAWVDVCVRGSGASFGARPCPWSEDEISDGPQVVDWIVSQPWSDGLVGSTGISYAGTSAELLASAAHPAVRAIAPRFSCFDVYPDVAFPGGLHLEWFTRAWGRFNALLDMNDLPAALALNLYHAARGAQNMSLRWGLLRALGRPVPQWMLTTVVRGLARGVAPVDGHEALLAEAVRGHDANYDVHSGALRVTHRDDPGLSDQLPEGTIDDFSPHRRLAALRASGVAVLNYSGWLDGGYAASAVKRHAGLGSVRSRLVLGPWNHGGEQDISPFTDPGPAGADHAGALLSFFDEHLRGRPGSTTPVRYYTLGAGKWRTAATWPPRSVVVRRRYLAAAGALTDSKPVGAGTATYRVDPELGTGHRSRWNSLLGLKVPIGYGDQAARCERMLCFTGPALQRPLEVTGCPAVHVRLSADGTDAAVFAYLMDVAPNGRITLVTEGLLRALHRGLDAGFPPPGDAPSPSFLATDGRPLEAGVPAELSFELLPTSYRFGAGHRLRLAIAGADCDHFASVPAGATVLDLLWGGADPARLDLPVVKEGRSGA